MNNRPGRCVAVSALIGKNHVEALDIVKSQIAFRRPAVDLRENRCKDISKSANSFASYRNENIVSGGTYASFSMSRISKMLMTINQSMGPGHETYGTPMLVLPFLRGE